MRAINLAATLSAYLIACASVNTTSQSLPGAAPKHYAKLLVSAATADLGLKVRTESTFVRAGVAAGVVLVPEHTFFLPGRAYADSTARRMLREADFAGVLLLADATTDAPTVMATAVATPTPYGTVVSASRDVRQDAFTIVSRVLDVADSQPIWVGSTRLERRGASDGQLFDGLARDVVSKLVASGVLVAILK
jgi:hypothetical protein